MTKQCQTSVGEVLNTYKLSKFQISVEEMFAENKDIFGNDRVCKAEKPQAPASQSGITIPTLSVPIPDHKVPQARRRLCQSVRSRSAKVQSSSIPIRRGIAILSGARATRRASTRSSCKSTRAASKTKPGLAPICKVPLWPKRSPNRRAIGEFIRGSQARPRYPRPL